MSHEQDNESPSGETESGSDDAESSSTHESDFESESSSQQQPPQQQPQPALHNGNEPNGASIAQVQSSSHANHTDDTGSQEEEEDDEEDDESESDESEAADVDTIKPSSKPATRTDHHIGHTKSTKTKTTTHTLKEAEQQEDENSATDSSSSSPSSSDDDDDDDDEDEEAEPQLKYQRLGGGVTDKVQSDHAYCLQCHPRFLVLGMKSGTVYVLDPHGDIIKQYRPHRNAVNDISIDMNGDHVATCSHDGRVVIRDIFKDVQTVHNFRNQDLLSIELHPNYGSQQMFVTGGRGQQLLLRSIGFFRSDNKVLHSGEGPIYCIAWKCELIAWANDRGVKIYDISDHKPIAHINRSNRGSPDPERYQCCLCWENRHTLLIGWGDWVKIGRIRSVRTQTGHVMKEVHVTNVFITDFYICGIAPFKEHLILLAFLENDGDTSSDEDDEDEDGDGAGDGEDDEKATATATATANAGVGKSKPPELRIVSRRGEWIATDALPIHKYKANQARDYKLVWSHDEATELDVDVENGTEIHGIGASEAADISGALQVQIGSALDFKKRKKRQQQHVQLDRDDTFYIVSPSDIVASLPRTVEDHITWLWQKREFEKAWRQSVVHASQLVRSKLNPTSLGEEFLKYVLDEDEKSHARFGALLAEVCGKDATLWQKWIDIVAHKPRRLQLIIEHIPRANPTLSAHCYELVLLELIKHDHRRFLECVKSWNVALYDRKLILREATNRLNEVRSSDALIQALAELYRMDEEYDKALEYYLQLKTQILAHVPQCLDVVHVMRCHREYAYRMNPTIEAMMQCDEDQQREQRMQRLQQRKQQRQEQKLVARQLREKQLLWKQQQLQQALSQSQSQSQSASESQSLTGTPMKHVPYLLPENQHLNDENNAIAIANEEDADHIADDDIAEDDDEDGDVDDDFDATEDAQRAQEQAFVAELNRISDGVFTMIVTHKLWRHVQDKIIHLIELNVFRAANLLLEHRDDIHPKGANFVIEQVWLHLHEVEQQSHAKPAMTAAAVRARTLSSSASAMYAHLNAILKHVKSPAQYSKYLKFFMFLYLHELVGNSDGSPFPEFHDQLVALYAEFDTRQLINFLSVSHHVTFSSALSICERFLSLKPDELNQRNLYECYVFILRRMGNFTEALQVILIQLKDVEKAVRFVEQQRDKSLWNQLIDRTLRDAKALMPKLLDAVKGHPNVDAQELIQKIPDTLRIDGLRQKIMAIFEEYSREQLLTKGTTNILHSDCRKLSSKLYQEAAKGIVVNNIAEADESASESVSICMLCQLPLKVYPSYYKEHMARMKRMESLQQIATKRQTEHVQRMNITDMLNELNPLRSMTGSMPGFTRSPSKRKLTNPFNERMEHKEEELPLTRAASAAAAEIGSTRLQLHGRNNANQDETPLWKWSELSQELPSIKVFHCGHFYHVDCYRENQFEQAFSMNDSPGHPQMDKCLICFSGQKTRKK